MDATVVKIILHRDEFLLDAPYNADGVAAIKKLFPAQERRWIPSEKKWGFRAKGGNLRVLKTLIQKHWQVDAQVVEIGIAEDQLLEDFVPGKKLGTIDTTNAYSILGCTPRSTQQEIKDGYRVLVKAVHPDIGEGGDARLFRLVTDAYHMLRDERARKRYDAALRVVHPKAMEAQAEEFVIFESAKSNRPLNVEQAKRTVAKNMSKQALNDLIDFLETP